MSTNGRRMQRNTCDMNNIESRGTLGSEIIRAERIIVPAYSPKNTGASLSVFDTPLSRPNPPHTAYAVVRGGMLAANNEAFKKPTAKRIEA